MERERETENKGDTQEKEINTEGIGGRMIMIKHCMNVSITNKTNLSELEIF